ncbi:MAG: hypothetical protein ACLTBV_15295 [Enterocloster bolteae]
MRCAEGSRLCQVLSVHSGSGRGEKTGKNAEELVQVMNRFGIDEDMIAGTGYGSCLFANKPGDGSAREQAASVRGSWRNCQSLFRVCNKEIPQ